MTIVYRFPPVCLQGIEPPTVENKTSRSVGIFTGASQTSALQPTRRVATAVASGIGPDRRGAGYVEALKGLLIGGQNLVRLDIVYHVSHFVTRCFGNRQAAYLEWTKNGQEITWTQAGQEVKWLGSGFVCEYDGLTNGYARFRLKNPRRIGQHFAAPGEPFSIEGGISGRILSSTVYAANGDALLVTDYRGVTTGGVLSIGAPETMLCEVLDPDDIRAVQGWDDWQYTIKFREVFEGERVITAERDPWQHER